MLFQGLNLNFDPDNLLQSLYALGGSVTRFLSILVPIIFGIALLAFLVYWFWWRRKIYGIPVRLYEMVHGQPRFNAILRGGFIASGGGAQTFKLMPTLRKRKVPYLIQPPLDFFDITLGGQRFINYLRVGKDIYMPFKMEFDMKEKAKIKFAEKIDLSSLESQLTANYLKFRGESFWTKYGNQVIMIAFAIVLGVFLLMMAKEFTNLSLNFSAAADTIAKALAERKEILQ